MGKLNDALVRNAKSEGIIRKLSDGDGLTLLITTSESKLWRLRYRFQGKEKTLSIGAYPVVSLKEARERAFLAHKQLSQGIDPSAQKQSVKNATVEAHKHTFEAVAREWHQKQSRRWTPEHASRVITSLENDVFGKIGDQPISQISAPMLIKVLQRIEARGAHEVASRILQRLTCVMRYAVQLGKAQSNPAAELRGIISIPKVKHQPALTRRDDVAELMRKIEEYDGAALTKYAMQFMALTFVRTGEMRGARWEEFDFSKNEWRIPQERMKMDNEHIVPLSRQALQVLNEIKALDRDDEFVFPTAHSGRGKTMSENTILYALYRMGYHSRMTGHGFRAMASTLLNESGKWGRDAIERQLAHNPASDNAVRAAYNRAEFLDERKRMMQWYADELDELTKGAQIIPFKIASN